MLNNKIPKMAKAFLLVSIIVSISILFLGGKMAENNTAYYFEGIEIQYETAEQRNVIMEALTDMLDLSEDGLKNKQYPDCFRSGRKINIEQVIHSFFVPNDSRKLLNNNFYKELQTKEVKELIIKFLDKLREDEKVLP